MTQTVARIAYFYLTHERAWVIQRFDADGFEIFEPGGGSLYIGSGKRDALAEVRRLEAEHGVTAERL